MFLKDILSRAFTPEVNVPAFIQELEEIDHKSALPVTEARWRQIKQASANDPVFQELRVIIQRGWPSKRKPSVNAYILTSMYEMSSRLKTNYMLLKGHQ